MSDKESKAFEFVLGTLSTEEREAFKDQHTTDNKLDDDLIFWENHLSTLNSEDDTLQPRTQTWEAIEAVITPADSTSAATTGLRSKWLSWLPWGLSLAMSCALVITLSFGQFNLDSALSAPIDYVAVLTDDSGQAKLTAITEGGSKNMWLQWDNIALDDDQDLQIWALSKSDNQIRSIAVIEDKQTHTLQLSDAHWRLIKDADSLILTAEDKGGSVLDEPSQVILAKGVCVRMERQEKAT
jgi:anti-sigma-K factor RskA